MSVILNNRWIVVMDNDPSYSILKINLYFLDSGIRKVWKRINGRNVCKEVNYRVEERLYKLSKNNSLLINRGLFNILKQNGYFHNSLIIDKQIKSEFYNFDKSINILKMNGISDILPNIKLNIEQLVALRKMFYIKRGIIQLPTGTGKTEIMCGFLKLFHILFNKYPTTVIIENNTNLVNGTYDRFSKYGIPCNKYSNTRSIENGSINICHPSSVCNDIDKNSNLLDEVVVLLCDECHHARSSQNMKLIESCKNLDYCIGLSASVISQDHINSTRIDNFSINELKVISVIGDLLMNMVSGELIDRNRLATPVLLRFNTDTSAEIEMKSNWMSIQKEVLQSYERNEIIVRCSEFFVKNNRKTLILVNTIQWSHKLLELFDEYNLSSIVRASYGGGRFEKFDSEYKEFVSADNDDVLSKFNDGSIKILIGTSHIYEGADINNLDVIILGYGGKSDRLQTQGTGRALRKTKTGKYAYIVDFTDSNGRITTKHSNQRFERYKNEMKISDDRIFNEINIGDLSNIFNKLEGIK